MNAYENLIPQIRRTYDLSTLDLDEKKVLGFLQEELDRNWQELNSTSIQTLRYSKLASGLPSNVNVSDFGEKLIELNDGQVMAGIRHLSMNPKLPFINLITSFDIVDIDLIRSVYKKIKNHFNVFNPCYLCWHSSYDYADDRLENFGSITLVKQLGSSTYDITNCVRDVSWSEVKSFYHQEYKLFHLEYPELKDQVPINSDKLMQGSSHFAFLENEQIVGMASVEKAKFLGEDAVYMNDILVSKLSRKQGVAKKSMHLFISFMRGS